MVEAIQSARQLINPIEMPEEIGSARLATARESRRKMVAVERHLDFATPRRHHVIRGSEQTWEESG